MLSLVAGTTSKSIGVFIKHDTTGQGLPGLAFDTASLVAYYFQPGVTQDTVITLATLATPITAWTSGGFVEIDATNMPGWYRLDVPNAVLTGATSVCIELQGAANMLDTVVEIELTAWNNQDAVRGGMTALPNANAAASNGLIINGSNAGNVTLGGVEFGSFQVTGNTLLSTGGTTSIGALNISGAVALGSTFAVAGTVTFNAFTVTATTTFTTLSAGTLSQIAVATRDVNDSNPAANSLGAAINQAAGATYGANPITVTVVDGSAVPIQNASVWVSDGVTAAAHLTNASGNASFSLNNGTYTVAITKAGYSFTPLTRTVTGNQTGTLVNPLVMTAVNVPPSPPANPAKGTVYGNIVKSDASSPAGIAISATLSNGAGRTLAYSIGNMLVPVVQETVADGNGDWSLDLYGNDDIVPDGSFWVVSIPAANFTTNITLVGGTVVNVDSLIV